MNDTPPQMEALLIERYRRMTPAEKLAMVTKMTQAVQKLALARIRRQYGDISEHEQKLRLAALWYGRDIMIHFFNWDPEEKGY